MNEQEVLEILNRTGAVITGSHIVYTSGKHGSVYVNKDALFPHDNETSLLCEAIAWQFRDEGVEVVVAPAIGGVILSRRVSHRLAKLTGRKIPGVYAERDEETILRAEADISLTFGATGKAMVAHLKKGDELVVKKPSFVLKRGYDDEVRGRKVLVVEVDFRPRLLDLPGRPEVVEVAVGQDHRRRPEPVLSEGRQDLPGLVPRVDDNGLARLGTAYDRTVDFEKTNRKRLDNRLHFSPSW